MLEKPDPCSFALKSSFQCFSFDINIQKGSKKITSIPKICIVTRKSELCLLFKLICLEIVKLLLMLSYDLLTNNHY